MRVYLWSNPSKTQVGAFHLKNRQASRELKVRWYNKDLEFHKNPVYLGVTLDRTLSFSAHISKLRGKIGTRNNLIRKLATSKWGADPRTLRSSVLALCYSAAEYCAPVWCRSVHAKKRAPFWMKPVESSQVPWSLHHLMYCTGLQGLFHHRSEER